MSHLDFIVILVSNKQCQHLPVSTRCIPSLLALLISMFLFLFFHYLTVLRAMAALLSPSYTHRHPHIHTPSNTHHFFSISFCYGPNLGSLAEHKRKFKPQEQDAIFTPANPPVEESSVVGRGLRLAKRGPGGFSFQLPCQAIGPSLKDNMALTYTAGRRTQGFSRTQAHSPTKQPA